MNLVVTIINLRAPGMSLMRMPVFMWMTFVAQFLLIFAMPVITVALFQLMFDRLFGTNFFNAAQGADPLLWQHLFWMFGHPEVYILILPAMGIVSEVLPVFARKPLFGYPVMVFSGIAIGFMGWGVWAHHMFATGLGPVAVSAFAHLDDVHRRTDRREDLQLDRHACGAGDIRFTTPVLFAPVSSRCSPSAGCAGSPTPSCRPTLSRPDTYYIVAHFHYVLFGGSVFGLFAGVYYW